MSSFPENTFALCISRSYGAGGLSFARRLQEVLGVPLYDKNILDRAAQDSNIRKELFEHIDEVNDFTIPISHANILSTPGSLFMFPENNILSNEHLFNVQADTITELARKSSGIFVGRCSDFILRDHPHMLSVFIAESKSIRIQKVKDKLGLSSDDEAYNALEKMDRERREYYSYYTSERWGRAENYDISIKLSTIGIEYATKMIVDLMKDRNFPLGDRF